MSVPDFYSVAEPDQAKDNTPDFYSEIEGESDVPDFYEAVRSPSLRERLTPKSSGKSLKELYPLEETPNTLEEKMQHKEDLKTARLAREGRGTVKGIASGATFGLSEYIPGWEPTEEDFAVGFGEALGSYLPINRLYKIMGKPLVDLAAKSPYARQGLMSLARMTGMGIVGIEHGTIKSAVKGEFPDSEELLKEGATWVGIDAALQALGLTIDFKKAVQRIALTENTTSKEILKRLWNSTQNWFRQKIMPENIGEPQVEVLMKEAQKAEKYGLEPIEAEVTPIEKPVEKPVEPKEEVKPIEKPKVETKPEVEKPVVEPEKVVEPEQTLTPEKVEEVKRQDITPKGLKEQKQFILNEVRNALTKTPEGEVVDIKVPGDGEFEIRNTPEALEAFEKRVQKMWPTKPEVNKPPEHKVKPPKTTKPIETSRWRYDETYVPKKLSPPKKVTTHSKIFQEAASGKDVGSKQRKVLKNTRVTLLQTRGKGEQYHGAKKPIKELNENIYDNSSDQNIYGPGFYTTDALDIADGYSGTKSIIPEWLQDKNGVKSTVYKVTEKKPQKMYDAEEPITEFQNLWETKQRRSYESLKNRNPDDISISYINGRLNKKLNKDITFEDYISGDLIGDILRDNKPKNLRELFNIIRKNSEHRYAYEVQEDFADIGELLMKAGYDGMSHTGGLLTNNLGHLVKIYWKPENLEIQEFAYPKGFKQVNSKVVPAEKPEVPKRPIKATVESEKPQKSQEPEKELNSKETPEKNLKNVYQKKKHLQPVVGKKQAVARSKIISLFRKAFNDPIRLGKIRQGSKGKTMGIHKMWAKVTRLLKDNDVETAAHEIGHNLHTVLYGGNAKTHQEQRANVVKALKPYIKELKPLGDYEPFTLEGFAEFTRLYVTNSDVAKELAPNFYQKFEGDLEANYPDMKNALLQAREYYDAYLQATPISRVEEQIAFEGETDKSLYDRFKETSQEAAVDWLDDVHMARVAVADVFNIPMSEVENLKDEANLYRTARLLKGAVGKADVFLKKETFDPITYKKMGESYSAIIRQINNKKAYREFNAYLVARRSIEKHRQGVETGIHTSDAKTVTAKFHDKWKDLAKQYDKYNDDLLKYALLTEVISLSQYKLIKLKNLFYAPFQRMMEPHKIEKSSKMQSGGGKFQAFKNIFRMKGSTRNIIPPLESTLKNTYAIIVNAEKNLAGKVLAKFAMKQGAGKYVEKVPTPITVTDKIEAEKVAAILAENFAAHGLDDLVEMDDFGKVVLRADIEEALPELFMKFGPTTYSKQENIITVYNQGKPAYYEVSPEIYQMWQKGMGTYTTNLLTKILRIPTRILRAGAILNPKFIAKNSVRDTWGAWLFTKYREPMTMQGFIDALYAPIAMLAEAAKQGPLYVEWMKAGGGMSTMQSMDRKGVQEKLSDLNGKWKPWQILKALRWVGEISDEANRLNEFAKALKYEGNTKLGMEIAAFASRDLSVDFAKMGMQMHALNQISAFFNVAVQGTEKFARTIKNPKDRNRFIPGAILTLALPSLITAWLNKDNEDVKELFEEEKDFNFVFSVGKSMLKIPVPHEPGVLIHGLTQRMFTYFMKKDPEAFEGFMGSIMQAMLPDFLPTIAVPVIETAANKNFFTGGTIIPKSLQDKVSKYQYKRHTSSTARLLGRAVAYMIDDDTRSKAASPAIIDHFITSWTGGLGRLMVNISDRALEAAGLVDKIPGREMTIVETLGLDAFSARYPRANTKSIDTFYDYYSDAKSRMSSYKYVEKQGLDTEEEIEKGYRRVDKIYDMPTLDQAYKAIQQCQREINNIWNDPSIDQELKEKLVDELYRQEINFAREAVKDIKKYRLIDKD